MSRRDPALEYSPPPQRMPGGLASIWIAVAVAVWCAVELKWDDPFQSVGNAKATRVATAAGVLGILVAVRDLSRAQASGIAGANELPAIGLGFNIVTLLAAWTFLPYL